MPRRYRIPMPPVAVAAAQDLWQITGATGKMVRVMRVVLGETDTTPAAAQFFSLRGRYLPGTLTNGSGGSSAVIARTDPGDAAASLTSLLNSTTKATTTGTAAVDMEINCHSYAGLDHVYMAPPLVGPGEAYVVEMLSTVSGTVTLSGYVEVEEMGG
jgi:hypothetical protein